MNDWDLTNIRADIMLATDIEHLQAIDNYYENIINNLQSKIDKAIEIIDLITPELWNISNKMTYKLKDVKMILKEDK